jgi:hypothetical protein
VVSACGPNSGALRLRRRRGDETDCLKAAAAGPAGGYNTSESSEGSAVLRHSAPPFQCGMMGVVELSGNRTRVMRVPQHGGSPRPCGVRIGIGVAEEPALPPARSMFSQPAACIRQDKARRPARARVARVKTSPRRAAVVGNAGNAGSLYTIRKRNPLPATGSRKGRSSR